MPRTIYGEDSEPERASQRLQDSLEVCHLLFNTKFEEAIRAFKSKNPVGKQHPFNNFKMGIIIELTSWVYYKDQISFCM